MSNRHEALDALRGMLSLTVLACHCYMTFIRPTNGSAVTSAQVLVEVAAQLAVIAFFALSGFAIAMSLDGNRRRHGALRLSDYTAARAFRILPPLLLTIVITLGLATVLRVLGLDKVDAPGAERSSYATDVLTQLAAIGTLTARGDLTGRFNGPLWSLAYEVQCYVVAGLVAGAFFTRSWQRAACVCLLVLYLVEVGDQHVRQPLMALVFCMGAAAYVFRSARRAGLAAGGFVLAALLVALAAHAEERQLQDIGLWAQAQLLAGASAACALIPLARLSAGPRLRSLGGCSYTIYILHFPLLQAAYFVLHNSTPMSVGQAAAGAVFSGCLTFAVCAALGRWLERPAAQRAVAGRVAARWLMRWGTKSAA
jgi:peptidoglycan/LPS O-acetylase OafA/YrhL